jgi:hypothetical protein
MMVYNTGDYLVFGLIHFWYSEEYNVPKTGSLSVHR